MHRGPKTITASGWAFFPEATWIIETVKTNDRVAIFLQSIDKFGGRRIVLPQKVCEAIYAQEYRIKKARRSAAAKAAMDTRRAKNPDYQPFGGKPHRKGKAKAVAAEGLDRGIDAHDEANFADTARSERKT